MSVWNSSALCGIYTLTPVHFGTGMTTGAVDLPIARETTTGFPVLPATGLKGVARDRLQHHMAPKEIARLFGKSIEEEEKEKPKDEQEKIGKDELQAGSLSFTEASLIAFPARSLNQPFLHVTCPLILERLERTLRVLGKSSFIGAWKLPSSRESVAAWVSNQELAGKALVLEDLVYAAGEVAHSKELNELAGKLAELLPQSEEPTRTRLRDALVLIPDNEFNDLLQHAVPVRARIQLTGGKTTDKWKNADGKEESGNLWYEEYLPADCLFLSYIGERRQHNFAHSKNGSNGKGSLAELTKQAKNLQVIQIGGNETVGYGLCFCTIWEGAA